VIEKRTSLKTKASKTKGIKFFNGYVLSGNHTTVFYRFLCYISIERTVSTRQFLI